MAIPTYGLNGVDWETRVDFERLRKERLARLKAELNNSSLGSLLTRSEEHTSELQSH